MPPIEHPRGLDRRKFLLGSTGVLASASGGFIGLRAATPGIAAEPAIAPEMVKLRPEIEPIVKWLESTTRDRVLEEAADRLRAGLPYRELMAALFLAGIRNIKPRPVGFKFHAVLVINSAHQLALDSPEPQRLYPLFWALDDFKRSQDADVSAGDWALPPAKEAAVPPATRAAALFEEAMESWDAEAADAAITALVRSAGRAEIMERVWPYASRNFRNIGHNIIFAAQAFRTLDAIGWQHAEPVLRSLVFGILDGEVDEPSAGAFRPNRSLAPSIRQNWRENKPDDGAAAALLDALRTAAPTDASRAAAEMLNRGSAAESLWDGVMLYANELSMRRRGIVALHAATAANSMHYAFNAAAGDATRRLLLLQGVSWMAVFRDEFGVRNQPAIDAAGPKIDELGETEGAPTLEAIFDEIKTDRMAAARQAMAFLKDEASAEAFRAAARGLIYAKGGEVHDYKFPAAAFEECALASPQHRRRLLAASVFNLKSSGDADTPLSGKINAALARLSAKA